MHQRTACPKRKAWYAVAPPPPPPNDRAPDITEPPPPCTLTLDGSPAFVFTASDSGSDVLVSPVGTNGYVGPRPPPPPRTHQAEPFQNNLGTLQSGEIFQKGPWPTDGSFAYLGVQFFVSGQPFYGWVYLSATAPALEGGSVATFTIQDWASPPSSFLNL